MAVEKIVRRLTISVIQNPRTHRLSVGGLRDDSLRECIAAISLFVVLECHGKVQASRPRSCGAPAN